MQLEARHIIDGEMKEGLCRGWTLANNAARANVFKPDRTSRRAPLQAFNLISGQ